MEDAHGEEHPLTVLHLRVVGGEEQVVAGALEEPRQARAHRSRPVQGRDGLGLGLRELTSRVRQGSDEVVIGAEVEPAERSGAVSNRSLDGAKRLDPLWPSAHPAADERAKLLADRGGRAQTRCGCAHLVAGGIELTAGHWNPPYGRQQRMIEPLLKPRELLGIGC